MKKEHLRRPRPDPEYRQECGFSRFVICCRQRFKVETPIDDPSGEVVERARLRARETRFAQLLDGSADGALRLNCSSEERLYARVDCERCHCAQLLAHDVEHELRESGAADGVVQ